MRWAPIQRDWLFVMATGLAESMCPTHPHVVTKLEDVLKHVQIAVMAKAPIAGLAKTRLIPAVGPEGAARLQRRLTHRAVHTALAAGLGPVTLWCAPDVHHRFFRALHLTTGVALREQCTGDLGARMHQAFESTVLQHPLLLIGTDCPALDGAHLRRAARALLDGCDAVFYPAQDGGYVLVGLNRPRAELFTHIPWSTNKVMTITRHRAHAASLRWREFEPLWDVDLPADLARLSAFEAGVQT